MSDATALSTIRDSSEMNSKPQGNPCGKMPQAKTSEVGILRFTRIIYSWYRLASQQATRNPFPQSIRTNMQISNATSKTSPTVTSGSSLGPNLIFAFDCNTTPVAYFLLNGQLEGAAITLHLCELPGSSFLP